MFISLKSLDKPRESFSLGSGEPNEGTAGCAESRMERESVRCGTCCFSQRLDHCAMVRSCAGVFSYFCDVVSYAQAEALLVNGRDSLKFAGTAQCVAAFGILACMVYSECGRALPFSFLLERFCRVQGQGTDSAFFDNLRSRKQAAGQADATNTDRESWHREFDALLRGKVVSVLDVFDNSGMNDTLRNACQILYSIGSLALDDAPPDRVAPGDPRLT